MTEEENKAAARRFFEAGWNTGDAAALKAFLADDFVSHNSLKFLDSECRRVLPGRDRVPRGLPDLVTSVEDVIAEATGLWSGDGSGDPPG